MGYAATGAIYEEEGSACPPNEYRYAGQCICRDGFVRDDDGACVSYALMQQGPDSPRAPAPPAQSNTFFWGIAAIAVVGMVKIVASKSSPFK